MLRSRYFLHTLFARLFIGSWLVLMAACAQPVDEKPVLRVGTSGDYEPFSTLNEDGSYTGFDIELANQFAEYSGYELRWVPFNWPELANNLRADRFDLAMSGITVRSDRSLIGQFTIPTTTSGAVVLIPTESPFSKTSQLDRPEITIGVNRGGHLERVTRATFQKAEIVTVSENQSLPDLMRADEIDCLVTDTMEAPYWLDRLPGARALTPFTQDLKACWLAADKTDLAHRLNQWLIERERDGQLAAWRTLYLPPGNDLKTAEPFKALVAAMRERLSLMVAVAEAKRMLGGPVEDLEQEARVLISAVEGVQEMAARRGVAELDERRIHSYFQIQMDVAKAIQIRTLQGPAAMSDPPDLVDDLRPALGRISQRIYQLLVDVSAQDSDGHATSVDWARDVFAELPVSEEEVSMLVDSISLLLD